MISEEHKEIINNFIKNLLKSFVQYLRTIALSVLAAGIITFFLAAHARNEMIKNLYMSAQEQALMEEKLAKQLVEQSNLILGLKDKKYSICIQVGDLYFKANDYKNAQIAYELAIEKAKPGVYIAHFKLVNALIAQEKFDEAQKALFSIKDTQNSILVKKKTRAYINMGDKYFSIGKFLKAAKSYEKAKFYYDRFKKQDNLVVESINRRIANSYVQAADTIVKSGYGSEAVRYLHKAEKLLPECFVVKYKLAIVYSDIDPLKSVEYFEPLLDKMPQEIDYGVYCKALMKAANIAELQGKPTLAKRYRYKIHSIDLLVNRKVVYKNDIDVILEAFIVKKIFFKYKLKPTYKFVNVSGTDIHNLKALFVLRKGNKVLEEVEKDVVVKTKPLYSNGGESSDIEVVFGKNIFTQKELSQYEIDTYLYKDSKYKTHVNTIKVPERSVFSAE